MDSVYTAETFYPEMQSNSGYSGSSVMLDPTSLPTIYFPVISRWTGTLTRIYLYAHSSTGTQLYYYLFDPSNVMTFSGFYDLSLSSAYSSGQVFQVPGEQWFYADVSMPITRGSVFGLALQTAFPDTFVFTNVHNYGVPAFSVPIVTSAVTPSVVFGYNPNSFTWYILSSSFAFPLLYTVDTGSGTRTFCHGFMESAALGGSGSSGTGFGVTFRLPAPVILHGVTIGCLSGEAYDDLVVRLYRADSNWLPSGAPVREEPVKRGRYCVLPGGASYTMITVMWEPVQMTDFAVGVVYPSFASNDRPRMIAVNPNTYSGIHIAPSVFANMTKTIVSDGSTWLLSGGYMPYYFHLHMAPALDYAPAIWRGVVR